ncbi:hypothetical protein ACWEQC_44410 [Streptomyces shenzhenensis]
MTVAWFAIEDFGALVRRHRVDDSLARAMTRLIRSSLIVIADAADGFFRLVDAAYERPAMAVSSNLHPSGFDEIMPKTPATAAVNRLLHQAQTSELTANPEGMATRISVGPDAGVNTSRSTLTGASSTSNIPPRSWPSARRPAARRAHGTSTRRRRDC